MIQKSTLNGLHKLITLKVFHIDKLINSEVFIAFSEKILEEFQLEKVGISVHDFDNKSYTIAICLKESHICIHTWPEFMQLTLDVYLCNYFKDNTETVREIVEKFVEFFEGEIISKHEIFR
ncbi:MAG: S-adenosylmethionine decarboxylase family protein [Flavobacterium sp.]